MRTIGRLTVAAALAMLGGMRCTSPGAHPLDELSTVKMTIKGQVFELWVAQSHQEITRGLMFITAEQMAPLPDGSERGMLFVFDRSVRDSFWMKNTVIPLDIAYISTDGTVVTTYTMTPMDDRPNNYPPSAPYRYALELNANKLSELGINQNDLIGIPSSVLKGTS